jgi:hypothetical protein
LGGSGKQAFARESKAAVNSGATLENRAASIACRPIGTSADPIDNTVTIFLAATVALAAVPDRLAAAANQQYSCSALPVKRA